MTKLADNEYLFTSESVTEGHPDKIADQISDGVLDAVLTDDPTGRVACETLVNTGLVVVSGEITTETYVDIQDVARETVKRIGYTNAEFGFDYHTCAVINAIDKQSPDIAQGVDQAWEARTDPSDVDGRPVEIVKVTISPQHKEAAEPLIKGDLCEHVIEPVLPDHLYDPRTLHKAMLVNPTGRFVIGGPMGDCGLTGRKIIVDTYGGMARHGGGAFSGKDPSKVDRSAAYAARYVAKNLVAAGVGGSDEGGGAPPVGGGAPGGGVVGDVGAGKIGRGQIA